MFTVLLTGSFSKLQEISGIHRKEAVTLWSRNKTVNASEFTKDSGNFAKQLRTVEQQSRGKVGVTYKSISIF